MVAPWRRRCVVGIVFAAVAGSACGPSSTRGAPPPQVGNGGWIVVDFNNGGPNDSYTRVAPSGATVHVLGVPGYLRAGFDFTLTNVAIVRGGELNGSAADQSTVNVSRVGSAREKVIWRFVGSVNYPLSWNPAGDQVAVGVATSIDRGGNQYVQPSAGLWVLGSDGSSHHEIVQGEVGPVAWSPDGKTLAFMTTTSGTPTALKVVPARGGSPRTITALPPYIGGSYDNPTISWSPDGRYLAVAYTTSVYATQEHTSQVVLYPLKGQGPKVILGPSSDAIYEGASYSPDGSELAVTIDERPPIAPDRGNTPPTTVASNLPISTAGQTLDLVNVSGDNLHPIAHFPSTAVMIGWYVTS